MAEGRADWRGKSGEIYRYRIEELPTSFANVVGNFILAKVAGNQWAPIFIGEGRITGSNSPEMLCAIEKGATHLLYHMQPDQTLRRMEVEDLLAEHPEVYAPSGCNKRK